MLERLLYRRLYGADELEQVLLTIGLIFMSVAVAKYLLGTAGAADALPPAYLSGQIDLGFRTFPTYRSFLIVAGAVLVTLLWLGLERTRFGAQHPRRGRQSAHGAIDRHQHRRSCSP